MNGHGMAGTAGTGAARQGKAWQRRQGNEKQKGKSMKKENIIAAELRRIAKDNDGILKPEAVVEAARPKGSPLHSQFDWNNSVAAEKWRIHQARNLIRVTIEWLNIPGKSEPVEIRPFVSLTTDRKNEGGGYRETLVVLRNKESRDQLLADALAELQAIEQKYAALQELAEVFAASRKVRAQIQMGTYHAMAAAV
jgi:hypothetical protein